MGGERSVGVKVGLDFAADGAGGNWRMALGRTNADVRAAEGGWNGVVAAGWTRTAACLAAHRQRNDVIEMMPALGLGHGPKSLAVAGKVASQNAGRVEQPRQAMIPILGACPQPLEDSGYFR